MSVQGAQVTLTTDLAAVLIAGSALGPLRVTVRNRGTGSAFLGSSGVTSVGFQLSSGETLQERLLMGGEYLYGCSTGAAPVLDVLRSGDTT
jgi:hypothetical protein